MKALTELEQLGFLFTLDGDEIHYTHYGQRCAEEDVRRLLGYLKRHRDELVLFLRERATVLDQMDSMDKLEWCRRWADLAERAGWPCTGYESWADWLADVAETRPRPPAQKTYTTGMKR